MDTKRSWTPHVTPSLVISLLALLIALSGTAYAVSKVNTADLAHGAVTTPKLAHNAVVSQKIHPRAVHAPDLARGAVTSAKVANGSLRLRDLRSSASGSGVTGPWLIPANTCQLLQFGGVAAPKLAGALVVGNLIGPGPQGGPVLDNHGVVLPTIVSESTQDPGVALFSLMVCDSGGSGQTIPQGSQYNFRVIGK